MAITIIRRRRLTWLATIVHSMKHVVNAVNIAQAEKQAATAAHRGAS